jgi:hypothetical protein
MGRKKQQRYSLTIRRWELISQPTMTSKSSATKPKAPSGCTKKKRIAFNN